MPVKEQMSVYQLRLEAQSELDNVIHSIPNLEKAFRMDINNEETGSALSNAYKRRAELNDFLRVLGQFGR
jgi:hypothetical protein